MSILSASRAEEIDSTFATARKESVDALIIGDDSVFDTLIHDLVGAAARYKIPTMYYDPDFVAAGGLISYGPSLDEMAKQMGDYLGHILEGAKPGDLPIQQPTKFELAINLATAKSIGLNIPPSVLADANRVIE